MGSDIRSTTEVQIVLILMCLILWQAQNDNLENLLSAAKRHDIIGYEGLHITLIT